MTKSTKSSAYALVRSSHAMGYGHLNVTLHDVFPKLYCTPSFVIRSQTGGSDMKGFMYGHKHGIEASHEPLNSTQLQAALKLMRRVDAGLLKAAAEGKRRDTYAEYVLAILHAARVRNVHYVQDVNGGWMGDDTALPMIDCFRDPAQLVTKLNEMSEALYARN